MVQRFGFCCKWLNKAKLDSVKENNYNVILVLEGKRIKI